MSYWRLFSESSGKIVIYLQHFIMGLLGIIDNQNQFLVFSFQIFIKLFGILLQIFDLVLELVKEWVSMSWPFFANIMYTSHITKSLNLSTKFNKISLMKVPLIRLSFNGSTTGSKFRMNEYIWSGRFLGDWGCS